MDTPSPLQINQESLSGTSEKNRRVSFSSRRESNTGLPLAEGEEDKSEKKHALKRQSRRRSSCETTTSESPALQSLQDIIADLKRLPTLIHSTSRESISKDYTADEHYSGPKKDIWQPPQRRHSEPPQSIQQNLEFGVYAQNNSAPLYLAEPYLGPVSERRHSMDDKEKLRQQHTRRGSYSRRSVGDEPPPQRSRSYSLPDHRRFSTGSPSDKTSNLEGSRRRSLYPDYLPASYVTNMIRSRELFRGTLQVDSKDSSDANVTTKELGRIYIYGSRHRNRALDGDIVAVELADVDAMLAEKAAKKQARGFNNQMPSTPTSLGSSWRQLNSIPEGTEIELEHHPRYCGKVVAIIEHPRSMLCSGTLSLFRPHTTEHSERKSPVKIIWFVPANKRLPLVAIPIKHAPTGFLKYHTEYTNRIFIANIQRWPATSLHPFGTIEREIGWMGELSVHKTALIADHHLKDKPFSESVLKSTEASIMQASHAGRIAFLRDIFTVEGFDVAFSISISKNEESIKDSSGVVEICVHVPDVAQFVRTDTPLDREACERAARVTLVDQSLPMFPNSLLEHCTFTVGKETAAYTVLCRMNRKGTLLHTWIGQTVIRPKIHLTIEDCQAAIHGDSAQWDPLKENLPLLFKICRDLQSSRCQDGGAALVRSHTNFLLTESGYPKDIMLSNDAEASAEALLQELIVLADREVGHKISRKYPEQAFLCRHEDPPQSEVTNIRDCLDSQLTDYDCDSLSEIIKSMERIVDDEKREAVSHLIKDASSLSEFFCAGSVDISKYYHRYLNVQLYTVFSQPLHNYASIMAQRQLNAALKGDPCPSSLESVEKVALHCTVQQAAIHACQKDVQYLYTAAYIYSQELANGEPLAVNAIVVAIDKHSITLYFSDFALLIDVVIKNGVYRSQPAMDLTWPSVPNSSQVTHPKTSTYFPADDELTQTLELLSPVPVHLKADMKTARPVIEVELICPFK